MVRIKVGKQYFQWWLQFKYFVECLTCTGIARRFAAVEWIHKNKITPGNSEIVEVKQLIILVEGDHLDLAEALKRL